MPRLKKREIPFQAMTMLLKSYGMTGPKFAPVLMQSHVTAKKKIEDPSLLTLGDLDRVNRVLGIPWEELREAVRR